MKQYLFILSHIGAGSTLLSRILNSTNKIAAITNSDIKYIHLDNLYELNNRIKTVRKIKDYAPIYCDTLNHNTDLYCSQYFKFCKFIFLLRPPRQALIHIYPEYSYNYYRFRLRRLYEYSKHTKNSICITYDDIISNKAFGLIEKFLNIKEHITGFFEPLVDDTGDLATGEIMPDPNLIQYLPEIISDKYEKYLRAIKANSTHLI